MNFDSSSFAMLGVIGYAIQKLLPSQGFANLIVAAPLIMLANSILVWLDLRNIEIRAKRFGSLRAVEISKGI
jgi:hypothetical protein